MGQRSLLGMRLHDFTRSAKHALTFFHISTSILFLVQYFEKKLKTFNHALQDNDLVHCALARKKVTLLRIR